ncbi:hypothetical protein EON65_57945 [archaeon]|nr:MAG: hypothetical protein EON65_57945 [archaeon]
MLWEQDRDDDDGLEQYVRRAIDANEITWFPLHKAIRLNQAATKEESLLNDLINKSNHTENSVATKLEKFQTDINTVLEQLNQALKGDHALDRQDASRAVTGKSRPSTMVAAGGLDVSTKGFSGKTIKVLNIKIKEVSGAVLSNLRTDYLIYVNVYFDTDMITVKAVGRNGDRAVFPTNEVIDLVQGVHAYDNRNCTLQVMHGEGDVEKDEELGLFEIPVEDFFLAEGCYGDYYQNADKDGNQLRICVFCNISEQPVP